MNKKTWQPANDIFLSHSPTDREFVARLASDLAAADFQVWLDQSNIRPGDSFAEAIDRALRASRFLLIVMSPEYFESAWAKQEWQYVLARELQSRDVRLIPILYRDCEIPPILRTKVWADFRDETQYGAALHRLVRDLHFLASSERMKRKVTEEPKPGERVEALDATTVSELKKALQDAVEAFRAKPDMRPSLTPTDLTDIDEEMCLS